ncbi:MAG TPA: thioredoxin domain-containing protein [Candidatus Sulfopaludibacter sp.]|nr:thioredoxin domain-containing protein [Candidatus Sulfopaludibacter sp.]
MSSEYSKLSLPVDRNRDHIQGPDTAPITLVEYGDYECPYCGQAYPIIKQIQDYFQDNLRFVFRNFPLTQVHPHAQKAAEAAEAADTQNKFWNMHDYLYEHQQALDERHLEKYAKIIGLNLERFNDDMKTHIHASRIREDFLSGIQSGVNGTPSFYINEIRYDGSWDFDTLIRILTSVMNNQ